MSIGDNIRFELVLYMDNYLLKKKVYFEIDMKLVILNRLVVVTDLNGSVHTTFLKGVSLIIVLASLIMQ